MCKYSEGEMSKLSVSLRFSVFSRWQLDRWKIGNFRERPLYSLFLSLPLSFRFRRILWNFHRRGSSRNASYLILPINGTFDIFARFNRTTCVNESGNGNERKRLALSGKAGNEIINWNYEGGVGGWLKPNDSNFISSVYNLYPTGSRNWGVSVLISWNKLPRLPAGKELLVRPANRTIPFLLSLFTSISLWYEIVCSTDLIAFTLIVTEGCNEHSSHYTITYISLKATMKDRDYSKTGLTRIYVYRDAHMIHTEYTYMYTNGSDNTTILGRHSIAILISCSCQRYEGDRWEIKPNGDIHTIRSSWHVYHDTRIFTWNRSKE